MTRPYPVAMPESVQRVAIHTPGGPLAALDARPAEGSPFHGTAVMLPGFSGSKEDFIPAPGSGSSLSWHCPETRICWPHFWPHSMFGSFRKLASDLEPPYGIEP
jgi:hypothetical protein